MKAHAAIWRPPDKREGRTRGETQGGPQKPNPGGTGETKVTRIVPQWQRGLTPELVAQIAQHRRSHPAVQLPVSIQLEVARRWREYARGTR
jgi:hypothetical protein